MPLLAQGFLIHFAGIVVLFQMHERLTRIVEAYDFLGYFSRGTHRLVQDEA